MSVEARQRRLKKLAQTGLNVLLTLSSTLLTLVAIEIGFRVRAHLENQGILSESTELGIEPPADAPAQLGHIIRLSANRDIIYELKPNLDVHYAGTRVQTDENGMRSPTSLAELGAAGYRIVGIGDSFMFGQGVAGEKTYLARLEGLLRARRPELDVRILNTAVPGYNTVMEIATLKEKALALAPDLVIVDFVANDLHLPNFIRIRQDVLALDRSFLTDFMDRRFARGKPATIFQRLHDRGVQPGLALDGEDVPPEFRHMVGFEAYVHALRELRDLSREHDFDVLSITLCPPQSLQPKLMRQSYEMGFHVLQVGKALRQYLDERGIGEFVGSPLSLSPDDGHPSALGHQVAADSLARFLLDEVLPMRRLEPAVARLPTRRPRD